MIAAALIYIITGVVLFFLMLDWMQIEMCHLLTDDDISKHFTERKLFISIFVIFVFLYSVFFKSIIKYFKRKL